MIRRPSDTTLALLVLALFAAVWLVTAYFGPTS